MSHKIDLAMAIMYTSIAGVGGAARFISRKMESTETICIKKFAVLLVGNVFLSAFSGMTVVAIVTTMTHNHMVHIFAASVGGYTGIEIMNIFSGILKAEQRSTNNICPS